MPTVALPAHEMLKLPGQTKVAWAVFDAAWYLAAFADAHADLGDAQPATVLDFYLEYGQRRGHSPNIWFDEAWYMQAYPEPKLAVRDGHASSGFDAYCRAGFRTRSPHWLFNETFYRQRYPDLQDDALANDDSANGYDHYLKHGSREGRIAHLLFDPAVYRAHLGEDERAAADTGGPYEHYLRRLAQRRPEIRTSDYFDPIWYLRRYPEIAGGAWRGALHHYLTNDTPTEFDPLPEFSEAYYLERYEDVAAAVAAKDLRNGYHHFLSYGVEELRSPRETLDLRYYTDANPQARSEIDGGRKRDAFVHYLTVGRQQGLATLSSTEDQVTEHQAVALHRQRANDLLPTASRMLVDFGCGGAPVVSVIIMLRDALPLTLMMLGALRAGFAGDIELILIDAGSTDDTRRIDRFVRGARVLRFDIDLDVVRAANAALNCATADAVLFLDRAVELAPGALAAGLQRLRSDPRIGIVGGKLVRAHGRLEAAGCIVWCDGSALDYLRDASPLVPEANFLRDVDCCSSAFLLSPIDVLRRVDGFDEAFAAGSAADADLCLRVAEAGYRIVYDPAITVTRLTPLRAQPPDGDAQQALLRKHADRLCLRDSASCRSEVFARSTSRTHRVLFIDDMVPLRQLGSGFVRSNDLIRVMAAAGYQVTVYPIAACPFGAAGIFADMPETVEVMYDRTCDELAEFLAARHGYYDVIWIARTHNLDRVKPMLACTATDNGTPRIVLDTEAIVALRCAEYAALTHVAEFDTSAAITREFANARLCHSIIAVTPHEAQALRAIGFADVTVIGHWRDPQPTPRAFDDRAGMLFLGAMHQPDSPNCDALEWFVQQVLPLAEQSLGWETRLTVAGYVAPGVTLEAYRDHPRVTLRGAVEDIVPLYDAHRLVVAPTRFAAGVPYKIHEAASFGVPVVASDLLRRQLGWQDGRDLLAVDPADAAKFAASIVALYRDATLWHALRDNALERVRTENNRTQYEAAVRGVLQAAAVA